MGQTIEVAFTKHVVRAIEHCVNSLSLMFVLVLLITLNLNHCIVLHLQEAEYR